MAYAAEASSTPPAVALEGVTKVYESPAGPVTALDDVTLAVAPQTFTAIMGPSGSGKSTLLQCAAGLDRVTAGRVAVDGATMDGRDETALTRFRRERIGFVFQELNLLPALTVLENVTLPLRLAGARVDRARATSLLERVGVGHLLDRRPAELSGGQQQRVAIARALVISPSVIFADEPTGALDGSSARAVLELLRETVRDLGQTVVMVTHDPVAASYADTVVLLADGRLAGRLDAPTPESVAAQLAAFPAAA